MLPSFLILGAQKAGTSSMFEALRQHPQLRLPQRKEIHFFDRHYQRGLKWYASQFPSSWLNKGKRTGEATPYYLFHPAVARRVHEALADVKLIVLLRNPTERAYAHFQMSLQKGNETILDFLSAVDAEPDRLAREIEKLDADPSYFSFHHQKHSYFSRGLYCAQLEQWLRYFPATQLHIVQSEIFFDDNQAALDGVASFLELSPYEFKPMPPRNKGHYAALDASVGREIDERYRESVRDLEQLLGRRFAWLPKQESLAPGQWVE